MAGPNRGPGSGRGPGGPGSRGGFQKPKNMGKTVRRLFSYVSHSKLLLLLVLAGIGAGIWFAWNRGWLQ